MTTVDDLPEPARSSLLKAYVESSRMPWLSEDHPALANAPTHDEQAYADGRRLRSALDMMFSADSSSELRQDEADYDRVARELNERYGEGLVLLSSEKGTPGLRGFRAGPFTTITETTYDAEGHEVVTVHDLGAEDRDANERDTADPV